MGSIVQGAIGVYGDVQQSQAAAGSAHYNAGIAHRNSIIAAQNAAIATQVGEVQTGMELQKTRGQVGAIKAEQGASGIETNTGSAAQTQLSARELGELDAQTIRSNALREAYNFNVQSKNFEADETLKNTQAKAASEAGKVAATGTFLASLDSSANKFAQVSMQAGGFAG